MLENPPFVRQKLKREDSTKVRWNPEERSELEEWKKIIDCDRDVTALKMALSWALGDLKNKTSMKYRIKMIKKKH